jgi:hypothetical protein
MTRDELIYRARLLSSARSLHHGKIPPDTAKWWEQIQAVALEYNLPISWDEWHSISEKRLSGVGTPRVGASEET